MTFVFCVFCVSWQPSEDVTWTSDLHLEYQAVVTSTTSDQNLIKLATSEARFHKQFRAVCQQRGFKKTSGGKSGYYVQFCRPGRQAASNDSWVLNSPEVLYINNLKGKGTFATCDIREGQIVCEYLGDIIDRAQMTIRDERYLLDGAAYKFIDLGHGKFIDGCRDQYGNVLSAEANPAATMNHSLSSPNCKLAKVKLGGIWRHVLKAITGISRRGECTWNYGDNSRQLEAWYYE